MLKRMSYPLIIEGPRESWPADFAHEAGLVAAALGPTLLALHHIGSTAIPGICAKPIIDLLGEVGSLEAVDARCGEMERLGYEVMGEFGLPGRRFFRKSNAEGRRTHHLHAFLAGSSEVVRHLAFRDYVRCHADVAREYDALKRRLESSCGGDREAYIVGKDAFVKDVERRALAWWGARE